MEENILHCRMEAVDLPSDRKVALITGITGNTIHTNTCIHTYKKHYHNQSQIHTQAHNMETNT